MARYASTVMVSALCPWDDAERLDEAMFRREIDCLAEAGFRHIYVFGTAGEGYAVDTERFRRVIDVFGDATAQHGITPMIGVIGLSTANVLERVRLAHGLGFREFQFSLPSWSVLSDAEVVRYVSEVCGTYPDSRFMHYNTAKVGRVVGGSLYQELLSTVPNLVATKTMSGDLAVVAGVVGEAPELMHFLTEQSVAYGALFGEVGLLGTFGALAPKHSWALLEAANGGDARRAAEIGAWFQRLSDEVLGPLMADRRVDGAYDKTIARLSSGLGDFPLRMLSPYRTIGDEEFATAERIFQERFADAE
jgi:dihydrodipicolinate synthase/N-acetylneuraminate lyase